MSINNFLFVKFKSLLLLFGVAFFRIIFIPIFYIFLLRISVLHFGKMIRLYIDNCIDTWIGEKKSSKS